MVGVYLKYPEKRDMIKKFGIMSCVSKLLVQKDMMDYEFNYKNMVGVYLKYP